MKLWKMNLLGDTTCSVDVFAHVVLWCARFAWEGGNMRGVCLPATHILGPSWGQALRWGLLSFWRALFRRRGKWAGLLEVQGGKELVNVFGHIGQKEGSEGGTT